MGLTDVWCLALTQQKFYSTVGGCAASGKPAMTIPGLVILFQSCRKEKYRLHAFAELPTA